jgi:Secretion system C-terminal sorting domain
VATLKWETASEKNNYGFEVERDTVRAQPLFAVIPGSFVPGHGTTLEPHSYVFVDSNVAPGRWAYRLKQIDLDGSVHVYEPVEIQLMLADAGKRSALPTAFALRQNFPNPFNPGTTIRYELPVASAVRLSLFDILGREVSLLISGRMEAGVHEVRFDASGVSSGVYFCRLQAGDFVQTKKLVVAK